MLKKDFDTEYDIHFLGVCPAGISREKKSLGCFNAVENHGQHQTERTCKMCWKKYIEKQDPVEPEQPGLFEIEQQDLEPGIAEVVNENFWDLIEGE